MNDRQSTAPGIFRRAWRAMRRPSVRYSLGSLLIIGFISGIIFWGGFHTVVEATNTEAFCISCHEMRDNVYEEYKKTVHYSNRTGVRAICSDCHVPKEWHWKMARKIQATNELYHKIMGTVNTKEKFEANRLIMAKRVWKNMRETDSRECRNCHNFEFMDFDEQDKTAAKKHKRSVESGKTCIDCHQGVAHELPDEEEDESADS